MPGQKLFNDADLAYLGDGEFDDAEGVCIPCPNKGCGYQLCRRSLHEHNEAISFDLPCLTFAVI